MTKTIKFRVLRNGEVIDYQTVIEQTIGDEISRLSCYDANKEGKTEINGEPTESDRAYFVPDCDYECIIRPIKKRIKKGTKHV